MLSVGSWFSPDDGSSLVGDLVAVSGNVLSVGFHISLLEVGSESVHVLVIWQNGQGFGSEKVIVPKSNQSQSQWQVILWFGSQKVLIHGVSTGVHFHPVVKTNGKGNGGSNGRPQGISSSDPIPESKHVVGIDTEFGNGLGVGRQSSKVLGNGRSITLEGIQDPLLGSSSVGHGFLGGKSLGSNQEESGFRITFLQDFGNMGSINIRAKVHGQVTLGVRLQGLTDHDGTEIGSANSNIDNGVDALSSGTLPISTTDLFSKGLDASQSLIDIGHDVLAVNHDGSVGLVSQGDVKNGTSFRVVDLFTGKHLLGHCLDILLFGKLVQQIHGFFSDAVLGIVH
mmetsp:Transcript_33483/g.81083  ORF Transcript_33483/g.81083 Transcript_33483/m.81083 type:complete len:339 (-) Transcript_33483:241-1257(-)